MVYAKPPFGGPQQVLKYLVRYTHRVAIANQRLVALQDGHVSFRWKDDTHAGHAAVMTLRRPSSFVASCSTCYRAAL